MDYSTLWMIRLVVVAILAVGGYQKARNYEREHGYTPWNLPHWTWSILWGLGLLPGALLWGLASRSRPKPPPIPVRPPQVQQFGGDSRFGGAAGPTPDLRFDGPSAQPDPNSRYGGSI